MYPYMHTHELKWKSSNTWETEAETERPSIAPQEAHTLETHICGTDTDIKCICGWDATKHGCQSARPGHARPTQKARARNRHIDPPIPHGPSRVGVLLILTSCDWTGLDDVSSRIHNKRVLWLKKKKKTEIKKQNECEMNVRCSHD